MLSGCVHQTVRACNGTKQSTLKCNHARVRAAKSMHAPFCRLSTHVSSRSVTCIAQLVHGQACGRFYCSGERRRCCRHAAVAALTAISTACTHVSGQPTLLRRQHELVVAGLRKQAKATSRGVHGRVGKALSGSGQGAGERRGGGVAARLRLEKARGATPGAGSIEAAQSI